MQSTNWKDIAELIGIAAIVGSLVFVGLQKKQAQEIAIAAQYHNRAAFAIEVNNAHLESGDMELWGLISGKVASPENTWEAHIEEYSPEQWGVFLNFGQSMALQIDNHYFQYQAGFMEEQVWQTHRGLLKLQLNNPNFPVNVAITVFRQNFRPSFIELCDDIKDELKEGFGE